MTVDALEKAATLTGAGELTFFSFPIEKVDTNADGDLEVYGKATDGSLDSDEQIVDPDFSTKAIREWLDTGGNIRVQHNPQRDPAGIGIEAEPGPDGSQWVKSLIIEPVAKRLVSKGALRAYSVGIAKPVIVRDGTARGGRITGGQIVEISLVDRPANKNCGIQLVKSSASGEPEWVGQVFGADDIVAKAAGMNVDELRGFTGIYPGSSTNAKTVTLELPEDIQIAFTPLDMKKIVDRNRDMAEKKKSPNVGEDATPGGVDRDKMDDSSFAGPNRTFPIHSPGDVSDAASLAHHADNPDAVRARIRSLARSKFNMKDEDLPASLQGKTYNPGILKDWTAYNEAHASHQEEQQGGKLTPAQQHEAHTVHELHEEHEAHLRAEAEAAQSAGSGSSGSSSSGGGGSSTTTTPTVGTGGVRVTSKQSGSDDNNDGVVDGSSKNCALCNGSGKIRGGNVTCPKCKGDGKMSDADSAAAAAKAQRKAERKAVREALVELATKNGSSSSSSSSSNSDDDSDGGMDRGLDGSGQGSGGGDDEDEDADSGGAESTDTTGSSSGGGSSDDNAPAGKSVKTKKTKKDKKPEVVKAAEPTPDGGAVGESGMKPAPAHREPDGPVVESFEHDAGLPTVPDDAEVKIAKHQRIMGVGSSWGALHDLTCCAFHPTVAAKCHPSIMLTDLIDPNEWQREAMMKASSAPLPEALRAQMLWQSATTLKMTDPALLLDIRLDANKAFTDANPGPGKGLTPVSSFKPGSFNRPYITDGHAAPSPGQQGPNSAKVPTGTMTASSYQRPYLDAGHASESPSNSSPAKSPLVPASIGSTKLTPSIASMKTTGDDSAAPSDPGTPGSSGRTFYTNAAKDNARQALQTMHDHIAQTFPDLCPMTPGPVSMTNDVPATKAGTPVLDTTTVIPAPGETARPVLEGKKLIKQLERRILKGELSLEEASAILNPPVITKAATVETVETVMNPDVVKAFDEMTSRIGELEKQLTQVTALAAQLANQPDPNVNAMKGVGLSLSPGLTPNWQQQAQPQASAPPVVMPTMTEYADRTQLMMLRELEDQFRTTPDSQQREAAWAAICKMRGIGT